jgi:Na+/melibiose symporter-like transporter
MYYGNIFYIPMWLQYVMGYSALKSGYLLLIYQLPSVVWGILSGQLISSTGRYKLVIIFGCATWTLSSGLQLLWTSTTKLPEILGILAVNQLAIGFCLQTSERLWVDVQDHVDFEANQMSISSQPWLR